MKNIHEYKTVSEWYEDAKQDGYRVPIQMCHGMEIAMKELNKSFGEIYEIFEKEGIFVHTDRVFVYNLEGYKAIPEDSTN